MTQNAVTLLLALAGVGASFLYKLVNRLLATVLASACFAMAGVVALWGGVTLPGILAAGLLILIAVIVPIAAYPPAWLSQRWNRRFRRRLTIEEPRSMVPKSDDREFWRESAERAPAIMFDQTGGYILAAEVRNPSSKPFRQVTARIIYETEDGRRETVNGQWSIRPGSRFLLGGGRIANIRAGQSRVLALGVAFKNCGRWAKYGVDYSPPRYQFSGEKVFSARGERVDLDAACRLTLEITADGIKHREDYRLSFVYFERDEETFASWEPRAERVTTPAQSTPTLPFPSSREASTAD